MSDCEHKEQAALMQWWRLACRKFGLHECLLFAIPNGGHRHIAVAVKMKAEGVRAGIPDLFLAVPIGKKPGLFIEMKKAKGGRVSDAQKEAISALSGSGYECTVCQGWLEAKNAIEGYIRSK